MSSWVVTRALSALFDAFDEAFPDRDRTTDGSIGDAAHQDRTSGHNPDDTSGSKPEYTDSDSKAEVRAIDVDKDLRASGVDMQDVVNAIIAEPNDRKRLAYMIYNKKMYSAKNGWKPSNYTGSNPHTAHAHFSGDPAYDEDGSPWTSVLNLGADMPMTEADAKMFASTLLGTILGSSGPTVGVALQSGISNDAVSKLLTRNLGSSGPNVGVALQTQISTDAANKALALLKADPDWQAIVDSCTGKQPADAA